MNDLSLIIYLISVISKLGGALEFLIIAIMVAGGLLALPSLIVYAEEYDDDEKQKKGLLFLDIYKKTGITLCCLFLVNSFLPSERTMYLMAASELGEEVINTEEFDKVKTIINKKLDEYLIEETDEQQ